MSIMHENLILFQESNGIVDWKKKRGEPQKLNEEELNTGNIGWGTYWGYFTTGKSVTLYFYILLFMISQIVITVVEYWLAMW